MATSLTTSGIQYNDGTTQTSGIYSSLPNTLLRTLNNPNAYGTSFNDYFGTSVAISGNYVIVGVSAEDDSGGTSSGKAYIYNATTGTPLYTLTDPNAYGTSFYDYFGISVAISGNYAIVGAYGESDTGGGSSGKAYIFSLASGGLTQTLVNPNAYSTSASDYFGFSVAIDGNNAIVGAYLEDDSGGGDSGKAYVYDVTTGTLLFTLNNPNAYGTSASDYFGYSVAISGNYAIVGAYGESDTGGAGSGKAYIFNVTTGSLVQTLNNPNAYSTSASDYFGFSVAISGNYAIVGAHFEDDAGGTYSGKAYVYNVTTGSLVQTLNNPNTYSTSASDYFGFSVAISGNYAIVGAYYEDDVGGDNSGKAYVYNVATGALLYALNNPNAYSTSAGDEFGRPVAISGNYVVVGAPVEDDASNAGSGKAYIFDIANAGVALQGANNIVFANGKTLPLNHDIFSPAYAAGQLIYTLNNPNAYSTSAGDGFGADGGIAIGGGNLAIGAPYEDDGSTVNAQHGVVYLFELLTGRLIKTFDNPSLSDAYGDSDYFGSALDMNDTYLAVGAPNESLYTGPSPQAGAIHVYNHTTREFLYTISNPATDGSPSYEYFGSAHSFKIVGNYIVAGSSSSTSSSGKAYVFNITNGALLQTLSNPNAYSTAASDAFGGKLAAYGNYLAATALLEDDSGGADSGKVYVFSISSGALLYTITNPNAYSTSAGDWFGSSIAISDKYLIVAAGQEDDASGQDSGKAYVFDVATGVLLYTLNNPNIYSTSQFDLFGYPVAISGNLAIIGARYEEDVGGTNSGVIYVFDLSTGSHIYTFNNPNAYSTSGSDYFGLDFAAKSGYLAVGVGNEDDAGGADSGKVYVFALTDMSYLDKAYALVS